MMQHHSWVSPKCAAGPSPIAGAGVFAAAPIAAGELLCLWGGVIVTATEFVERSRRWPGFDDRCIAVGRGFWLAPPWPDAPPEPSEQFNHSCEPNAGVRGQVALVARRAIAPGEEVTFDYETVETDLLLFGCRCGAARCRGVIDGTASQNPEFRRRHAGYLSWDIEQAGAADSTTVAPPPSDQLPG